MAPLPVRLAFLAILAVSIPAIANEPAHVPAVDLYGDPLPPGAMARLGTLRFRAVSGVDFLAYSPDSKQLLSKGDDAIAIWNAKSGRKEVEFASLRVGPMVWRGDGRGIMLIQEESGSFRFGDFTRETLMSRQQSRLLGHVGEKWPPKEERIKARAISPDGKYFVAERTNNDERSATVWALEPGMPLAKLRELHVLGPQRGICHQIVFSPESRFAGILSGDYFEKPNPPPTLEFVLYELATGKECHRRTIPMPGIGDGALTVALGPEGGTLTVGGHDDRFRIHDLRPGGTDLVLGTPRPPEYLSGWSAVAISGKRVFATKFMDEKLYVFDIKTGEAIPSKIQIGLWVNCLAISTDGKRLATNAFRGVIRQWDLATGEEIAAAGPKMPIQHVQILPDGRRAVMWGADFLPRVWELPTGKELSRLVFPSRATDIGIAPDAKSLLARVGNRILAFDLETGMALQVRGNLSDAIGVLQPPVGDGRSLVFVHSKSVQIWDWPEGRLRRTFDLKDHNAYSSSSFGAAARLTSDGRWLVVRTLESGILVWDAETGVPHTGLHDMIPSSRFSGRPGPPLVPGFVDGHRPFAFLEGHNLTSLRQSRDRFAVWDLRSGKISREFEANTDPYRYGVMAVTADPRGYVVATAESSWVNQLKIYEAASGQIRQRLTHEDFDSLVLAFSPDANLLLTAGGYDSTGLVWDLSLKAAARGRTPPPDADLERSWHALSDPNATAAYEGLLALASNPDRAIDKLRQLLPPVPRLNTALIERLVADLGSERFAVRQRASSELDKFGRPVIPALKQAHSQDLSLETKRRISIILGRHDTTAFLPEELRAIRSLEFLEGIGTPAARTVIADLTKGEPTADLTIRAIAAKSRLDQRKN